MGNWSWVRCTRASTYATIGTKHVHTREVHLVAGIASARQASKRVVGGSGGHVGGQSLGRGNTSRRGRLGGVAGGALDHVDGVVRLDLVCGKGIVVFHDAARVDEPLAFDGDILKVGASELSLEVENRGALGHCDDVVALGRRLDLEGELGIAARFCVVGHGARRQGRLRMERERGGKDVWASCWLAQNEAG